jgi:hypothetical protein
MKTMFGQKSLPTIRNQQSVGGPNDRSVVFLSNEGLSRYRCYLRGGSQPRRANHHGSSARFGSYSREAEALQGSWYMPDNGASLELVDDRTGDVAVVSATSEANAVRGSP